MGGNRQEKPRTGRSRSEELGSGKLRLAGAEAGECNSQRRGILVMTTSCRVGGLGTKDWDCPCEQNEPDSYQTGKRKRD